MSLDDAQRRLQKALDRLESAARRLKDRAQSPANDDAERERLSAALDKAREDRAALERANQAAGERLGAVAARIKAVMEG